MIKTIFTAALIFLASTVNVIAGEPTIALGPPDINGLYQHLQDVSVTVKAQGGEGSGVIVTRAIPITEVQPPALGKPLTVKVNFVWTAAHVVDSLRSVRTVIKDGQSRKMIEFKDAQIVQELVEDGRRVGEMKMEAKIIKYSDSENGEDLALLMIRKKGYIDKSVTFYQGEGRPVAIGTELYHVGSLLGQTGSNSMTRGICSQVGRVLNLGNGAGVVFDQTTVTAFPGSSGGGVFLSERSGDNAGQYMGMLVRGAGETFNLIVPIRRMRAYAKREGILWAIDSDCPAPTLKEITSMSVEGARSPAREGARVTKDSVKFPKLPLRREENED
tara:strand:- start:953 stop:1942 length:990 start_codon:yes stop_codon:yes gene_type:complete